jgi:hypothetical protein
MCGGGFLLMTKTNPVVAAVLAASLAGTVQATVTTGNDLQQYCNVAPTGLCAGYVLGVTDTTLDLYCFPPGVTRMQIRGVAVKYLNNHPEKLHLLAPGLVIKAMQAAFPCKQGR